jgi:hypothetical protein
MYGPRLTDHIEDLGSRIEFVRGALRAAIARFDPSGRSQLPGEQTLPRNSHVNFDRIEISGDEKETEMTKDQHGRQPGQHEPGRSISERFRAWLTTAPMLSLATCARCATTQVLSRDLEAEAQRILRCRHCGTEIATVDRGARTTWIEPFDSSAKIFPTSRYQVTRASSVDRSSEASSSSGG